MVNRTVVGAHYGLRDWLMQRITAIVMAVYSVVMAGVLLAYKPLGFFGWKALFGLGWMRIATLVFFLSLFLHAWVGMRDIIMDYIKPAGWRLTAEIAVILALVSYAAWAVSILWRT
jgi:succinate dehydrogenase / fumarate reductase, membrane anchor subunit